MTGAVATPPFVAATVVREALKWVRPSPSRTRALRAVDPAVGAGAFLLAVAQAVPGAVLAGTDVDEEAVCVAREVLGLAGVPEERVALRVGDGLAREPGAEFDLVVGNPPFLSPLTRAGAPDPDSRSALRRRFGDAATAYVDLAALFVLQALDLVAPGGAVGFVLPASLLATRDGRGGRDAVLRRATLRWLWHGISGFDAKVAAVAVVLTPDTPRSWPVGRANGPDAQAAPEVAVTRDALQRAPTWSHLVARGVPPVDLDPTRTLSGLATATADFRDQFYGLVPFVHDLPDDTLDAGLESDLSTEPSAAQRVAGRRAGRGW